MKEKKIGEVNVDSGTLMITDPLYLSDWQNTDAEDKREYKDTENGKIYVYSKDFKRFDHILFDNKTVNQLIAEKRLELIFEENKEYSYKAVSHTLTNRMFVECEDKIAVAFRTGNGDGTYPVYATFENERIVEIRIDLSEKGELNF